MKVLLAALLVTLSGFGNSPDPAAPGAAAGSAGAFSGTYVGVESGNQAGRAFSQSVTVTVAEDANGSFGGTWLSGSGTSGMVSGVRSGEDVTSIAVIVPAS